MSGLLSLLLIGLGFFFTGLIWFAIELDILSATHSHEHSFTADLRGGRHVTTSILLRYRDGDTDVLFEVERTVREWAAGNSAVGDPPPTPGDYQALDAVLRHAHALYQPRVIRMAVSPVLQLDAPPSPPTLATKLVGDLERKRSAAEALATAIGIDDADLIQGKVQSYGRSCIVDLFEHPDHV